MPLNEKEIKELEGMTAEKVEGRDAFTQKMLDVLDEMSGALKEGRHGNPRAIVVMVVWGDSSENSDDGTTQIVSGGDPRAVLLALPSAIPTLMEKVVKASRVAQATQDADEAIAKMKAP